MRSDEELEQLRAEKTAWCDALRRKDEELEQSCKCFDSKAANFDNYLA